MESYPWPGNVRELQNLVERAVILAEGPVVNVETLGLPVSSTAGRGPARDDAAAAGTAAPFAASGLAATVSVLPGVLPSLDEMEKQHILRALECTNGNRTQAANLLKISIRTLRNKLHQYRIEGGTEEVADTAQRPAA